MPNRVTVTVPATSANLGPGFDCLGLALTLRNTITLSRTPGGVTVEIEGEGADSLPRDDWNIVIRAAYHAFAAAGEPIPGLALRLVNHVPAGSGLGSSATAIVGGLVAANVLMDGPLSQDELLRLAVEIEGHPDNVAPALLGGLVISSAVDGVLLYRRSPVVPLQVVLVKPDIVTSTHEQRAALPEMVRHRDAAANVGRAALVVRALQDGDLALLGAA
ncbi:MAG: homoserine kinase, partial [Anaerolineae bacterium]|nr:homoserine kinase [Anaerolineae bacterium]